ncbi:MAG: iron-containing alcohol dehydrogenase [Gemmatimonadaceae bacterium]
MVAVTGLPYPVTIAPAALDQLANVVRTVTPGNRCVVISDTTVAGHYGSRVSTLLGGGGGDAGTALSFPFSEQDKTRELWSRITDALLDDRYGRDTTLVALGGGVVGDVVGFVAATYMRGIPVIQVPTSLLAMVDACIGGKTGVDTRHGKNLVGAFHQPSAVIIDPLLLETLPANHLRAGFAEIIKHGVIADDGYFDRIRAVVESWPPPGGGGTPAGIS